MSDERKPDSEALDPPTASHDPSAGSAPTSPESELGTDLYRPPVMDESATCVAGQVIGDRYRIDDLLGRGGMGEVWRAYDLKLRVEVGLKSVLKDRF